MSSTHTYKPQIVETQIGLRVCSQWTPSFMTRDRNTGALPQSRNGLHPPSRSMRLRSHPSVFRKRQTRRFLPLGWKATFQAVHYQRVFDSFFMKGKSQSWILAPEVQSRCDEQDRKSTRLNSSH